MPLADEEYVLVAAPQWTPRTGGAPAPDALCARLKDVPLVTHAEDLPIVRRCWRLVLGKQLTAQAAVTVPNLYAVVSAVAAAAGYSVLPRSLCQDHLAAETPGRPARPGEGPAQHAVPRAAARRRRQPRRPPRRRHPPPGRARPVGTRFRTP
ncbi:LysR substrate-binding domain-containing protein [Streptomyces shaanxiensis]|uniref:LysR substrate-binding domain-containing protein n=1 Tax=Streptomyces shaanxiensis TaxID=653357 RepID=A0ABP7UVE7_9ACTN